MMLLRRFSSLIRHGYFCRLAMTSLRHAGFCAFLTCYMCTYVWASNCSVTLQVQDKITGHVATQQLSVGDAAMVGPLEILVERAMVNPPDDRSEAYAFLTITDLSRKVSRGQQPSVISRDQGVVVFSNWMFASSPALSALDHPLYDVWIVGAKGCPVRSAPVEEGEDALILQGANFKVMESSVASDGVTLLPELSLPIPSDASQGGHASMGLALR